MKYYVDPLGALYAYESDGSQDHVIPEGFRQISDEEAEAIRNPKPTFDQLKSANIAAIQAKLDATAQSKGYDNIVSACSYAAHATGAPFQAEGAAFLRWRSDVWAHAYAVLADVEAGIIPMPTPEEAVAQMPALVLP